MEHFRRFFLLYTLIPLIVISFAANYYRFMVAYDYEVVHEGSCDPYQEQCYMYCEDEECSDPFYYTNIHREASSLRNICSDKTVTECELAQTCQPFESSCITEYCTDNDSGECESLNYQDLPEERD
jgi:hypothetical protein